MINFLRKAPTAVLITVIIVCGFLAAGVFASYVILTLNGEDTTEFRQWINTLGQILVFPFLGVTTAAAVSAAKSAGNADEQTNGHLSKVTEENNQLRDANARLRRGYTTGGDVR